MSVSSPPGEGAFLAYEVIDDPVLLAKRHTTRAIERLAELMECDGRQSQVAVMACKVMIEVACPRTTDDARVEKLVEARFRELVEEARKKLEQRQAGLAPVENS